jgi:hypothetical protein
MKGFRTLMSEKLPDIQKQNDYFSSAKSIEELIKKMKSFNDQKLGNTIDIHSYENQYNRIITGEINTAEELHHIIASEPTGLFRKLRDLIWDDFFSKMSEAEQKELIFEISKESNKDFKKAQIINTRLKLRQMEIKNKKK